MQIILNDKIMLYYYCKDSSKQEPYYLLVQIGKVWYNDSPEPSSASCIGACKEPDIHKIRDFAELTNIKIRQPYLRTDLYPTWQDYPWLDLQFNNKKEVLQFIKDIKEYIL